MDELVQAQSLWFPMCSGRQIKDELYLSLPHHNVTYHNNHEETINRSTLFSFYTNNVLYPYLEAF